MISADFRVVKIHAGQFRLKKVFIDGNKVRLQLKFVLIPNCVGQIQNHICVLNSKIRLNFWMRHLTCPVTKLPVLKTRCISAFVSPAAPLPTICSAVETLNGEIKIFSRGCSFSICFSKSNAKPLFAAANFSDSWAKIGNAKNPINAPTKIMQTIIFEKFMAILVEAETLSPKPSTF